MQREELQHQDALKEEKGQVDDMATLVSCPASAQRVLSAKTLKRRRKAMGVRVGLLGRKSRTGLLQYGACPSEFRSLWIHKEAVGQAC